MKSLLLISFIIITTFPLFAVGQQIKKEITEERNFFTKKYKLGQNRYQVKFSSKPMHYKDNSGNFKDINLNWYRDSEGYINDENTFITKAEKGRISVLTRQNKKLLFEGFKFNTQKLEIDDVSMLEFDKLKYSGTNNQELLLIPSQGVLKLQFNNLTLAAGGKFSLTFKIKGDFDFNSINIQNNQIDLQGVFGLTASRIEANNHAFYTGKFKIVEQKNSYAVVEIGLDASLIRSNPTVYSVTTIVTDERTLTGAAYSVDSNGDYPNISGDDDNLIIGSGNNKYRTLHRFSIFDGFPNNVDVLSANYQFEMEAHSVTDDVEIVRVTGVDPLSSGQTVWNAIGNGSTVYDTFKPSDYTTNIYSEPYDSQDNLCTYLENDINDEDTDYFFIGLRFEEEVASILEFTNNISLEVEYEVPPVSITADNNFTAANETDHGLMKIDGVQQTIPTSGYTFPWDRGTNLSLEALSPQTDSEGYQRIWNTNSCVQKSYWARNGDLKSNNQIYTFEVTDEDDEKTYLATFYQVQATTSGTVSSNETWNTEIALTGNISIPSGVALTLSSCSSVNLGNYSIISTGGTIAIESGANITPDIRLQTGSIIEGLYPTIPSAFTASSSGQTVHLRGSHTLTSDLTVASDRGLTIKEGAQITLNDYRELYVYGTLTAIGTSSNPIVFTSADGTSGNSENAYLIRLKNSTSDNSILQYCEIKNAVRGVYFDNSDAKIQNCEVKNCTYGIYNYYSNNYIWDNEITNTSYGIYNYHSSPMVENNEIVSSYTGIKCESYSSPDLAYPSDGHNYLHGSFVLFGVYANNNSNPYLGNGSCDLDWGRNTFDYDNFDLAVIYAGTNCTIMAENNYWGTSNPNSGLFSGNVDWQPYLTSQPSYNLSSSPEIAEFNAAFSSNSVVTPKMETDVLSFYDSGWSLKEKTRFIQALIHNDQAQSVHQLCKDIINEYPDSSDAFFALDLLYQASRQKNMTEGKDLDSFKDYLLTLTQKKDKKTLYGSAELLLSALEKEKGLEKIDNVFNDYRQTYLAEIALFQKFMYYYNENGDDKNCRSVLAEMEKHFPSSEYTLEAYQILGEKMDEIYAYKIDLKKAESFDEEEYLISLPEKYELEGAYPNPFNPSTTIQYALPLVSKVDIYIFNSLGQKINHIKHASQNSGHWKTTWNGTNQNGQSVPSGIYFIKFKAESLEKEDINFEESIKLTLIR